MTPGDPLNGAWTGARWPGTITGNVITNHGGQTFTIDLGADMEAAVWDTADLTAVPPSHTIQIEPATLSPSEPPLAEDPFITFWKGESAL